MSELIASIASSEEWQTMLDCLPDLPFATWESFYATVLTTLLALVIGLPLGVLLVVGDKNGLLPLPRWLMAVVNIIINLLRSVPFLILMILVQPLSQIILGTTIGTVASIVPLVAASFPFVARLVETSLREVDGGVVEAAQSMGATPLQIITRVMIPERPAQPDRQCHHRPDHRAELCGHGRHHRRRRSGPDRHQLRLLPLPVPDHGGGHHPAGNSGAGVPERGHLAGRPLRQAAAQVSVC